MSQEFDDEEDDEEAGPGMGIEPELMEGHCLSLLQVQEMIAEAIRRLPADVKPESVPVVIAGRAEHENGEFFHLQDLWFCVNEKDPNDWEAMLITDGSGSDPILDAM